MTGPDDLLGRCTFPAAGTAVVCGVSGGADSSALLVLAVHAGCEVTAVHVDHGLRPGSTDEAERVAAVARRYGADFRSLRVAVTDGPNLEARARAARHRALGPGALLGHTADDRAETLLINLLRGAGPEGLAAMGPDPRRPLLALRRADTVALCRSLGIETVDDPSNHDPRFVRNRIRHELLPLITDIAGRDPVPLLVRTGDHAGAVAALVRRLAEPVDPTDARALSRTPTVVAAQAVRAWLRGITPDRHPPDAATVERVLAVARGEQLATEVGGGWRVSRRGGRLRLEAPEAPSPGATDAQ